MIADNDEINVVKRRLEEARNTLHRLAPLVGAAKQVREYDSDRRKNVLAKYIVPFLKTEKGVAASEAYARANDSFQAEIEALAAQREASEKTIAQYEAAFASFEAARSLLSMEKETLRAI
jgi:hypothetical protein